MRLCLVRWWAGCRAWREGGRARKGVVILLTVWMLRCVIEWKQASSRVMWVRVKIERERWVFISAYGPGNERCEEEIKEFWSELQECRQFW